MFALFMCCLDLSCCQSESTQHDIFVVIFRGPNVDSTLVLIMCSDMYVFFADALFESFLRTVEEGQAYMDESDELKTWEFLYNMFMRLSELCEPLFVLTKPK